MEEITEAAKTTYEKLPEEEKKEIEKMFKSMDQDGDGTISVQEFETYLEKKGDEAKVKSNLFNLIDRNGDGNLQFDEVLTLFYIIESSRSVCNGCGNFIQGLFFTCSYCHYSRPDEDGFDICIDCYKPEGFVHDHTEFIDNYTLFVEMKKNNGAGPAGSARLQTNSSLSSNGTFSSTGTIQPRNRKRDIFKRGFKGFMQLMPGVAAVSQVL